MEFELEIALDSRDEGFVVGAGFLDDLFVALHRPRLRHGSRVRSGRIAQLPAVAVDYVADEVADERGRVGLASAAANRPPRRRPWG